MKVKHPGIAVLGSRLKGFRESKLWTQAELARQCNIPSSYVSRYESGEKFPDPVNLAKIAKIMEVEVDYLLSDEYEGLGGDALFFRQYRKLNQKNALLIRELVNALSRGGE